MAKVRETRDLSVKRLDAALFYQMHKAVVEAKKKNHSYSVTEFIKEAIKEKLARR